MNKLPEVGDLIEFITSGRRGVIIRAPSRYLKEPYTFTWIEKGKVQVCIAYFHNEGNKIIKNYNKIIKLLYE